jgi:hypothetical protein
LEDEIIDELISKDKRLKKIESRKSERSIVRVNSEAFIYQRHVTLPVYPSSTVTTASMQRGAIGRLDG